MEWRSGNGQVKLVEEGTKFREQWFCVVQLNKINQQSINTLLLSITTFHVSDSNTIMLDSISNGLDPFILHFFRLSRQNLTFYISIKQFGMKGELHKQSGQFHTLDETFLTLKDL